MTRQGIICGDAVRCRASLRLKVLPARGLFNLYQTADSISDNLKRQREGMRRSEREGMRRGLSVSKEGRRESSKEFVAEFSPQDEGKLVQVVSSRSMNGIECTLRTKHCPVQAVHYVEMLFLFPFLNPHNHYLYFLFLLPFWSSCRSVCLLPVCLCLPLSCRLICLCAALIRKCPPCLGGETMETYQPRVDITAC